MRAGDLANLAGNLSTAATRWALGDTTRYTYARASLLSRQENPVDARIPADLRGHPPLEGAPVDPAEENAATQPSDRALVNGFGYEANGAVLAKKDAAGLTSIIRPNVRMAVTGGILLLGLATLGCYCSHKLILTLRR